MCVCVSKIPLIQKKDLSFIIVHATTRILGLDKEINSVRKDISMTWGIMTMWIGT